MWLKMDGNRITSRIFWLWLQIMLGKLKQLFSKANNNMSPTKNGKATSK